jgi:hypothetical protein
MWDLYLGYCEAAFQDRHIGNVQLLFAKSAASIGQDPFSTQPIDRSIQLVAREPSEVEDREFNR